MQTSTEKIIKYFVPAVAGVIMFIGLVLIMFGPSPTGNVVMDISKMNSSDLDMIKEQFNLNLDQVPRFVKSMFGNERMNIFINTGEGEREFYVVTKKGSILELKEGSLDDPSLDMWSDQETIDRISESENPTTELRSALKSKEIRYETHAVPTKIRMGLARFSFGVYSFFKR